MVKHWLIVSSIVCLCAFGQAGPTPRFEDYSVPEIFEGTSARPVLDTAQKRLYQSRIRTGVSTGKDVWNGSWKNPIPSNVPNFAGHYFVIRWGCGSNCLMMAVVDAQTGIVHGPPLRGSDTELVVNMDMMGEREIDFQRQSSLMILRNACKYGRSECGIYYFNWNGRRFNLIRRTLIDLTQTAQ